MGVLIEFRPRNTEQKCKAEHKCKADESISRDNGEHIEEACRLFGLLKSTKSKVSQRKENKIINKAKTIFNTDPDAAIDSLKEFADKYKVSVSFIKEIACMYIDKERDSKNSVGKELLEKIADSNYCDAETTEMLAYYHKYYSNDEKKQKEYLEKWQEFEPENPTALCMLAEINFMDNLSKSLQLVKRADEIASKNPEDEETRQLIDDLYIFIYDEMDDYDKVLQIVNAREEYKTDDTQVYLTIGGAYINKRNYAKGIEYYEKARENSKANASNEKKEDNHSDEFIDFDSGELINLADLYIRVKRFEDAKECIDEAFKFVDKKKDPTIYANLIRRKKQIEANL